MIPRAYRISMSDGNAIVLHLNRFGTVLHMENYGVVRPFRPRAECLGRTLQDLLPGDIGIRAVDTIRTALLGGQSDGSYAFSYTLPISWNGNTYGRKSFVSRMTYLREGVVLCVIQTQEDDAKFVSSKFYFNIEAQVPVQGSVLDQEPYGKTCEE